MGKDKIQIPDYFKRYFWDVDFEKINPRENASYIIVRLLERGDEKVIRWLLRNYSKDLIKEVVMTRRGLSPKTAIFWTIFLSLDKRKVVCLQKPYLKMRQPLWPY